MAGEPTLSRAELVRRGAGAALLLGGAGRLLEATRPAAAATRLVRPAQSVADGYRFFRSRPSLRPPLVTVLHRSDAAADGYLFLAPNAGPGQRGVLIADDRGEPVWFRRTFPKTAMNFRAALYRGKPVLTWWEGSTAQGLGRGEHVIVDDTYTELARFPAGAGRQSDLHELLLTRHGTALVTAWETRQLTVDGRRTPVVGGVVQEIEVPSARVLFEWRSLDHVDVSESYVGPGPQNFDYFHVNSIDVDDDGNWLLSARNTWALYKIDRRNGRVLWRLGGKRSDFAMGPGTQFSWQHDARHLGGGDRRISVFDDGAAPAEEPRSRVLVLDVDHRDRRVTLAREYRHTRPILARAMGNAQPLGNGDVLVGWGTAPYVTEFSRDGAIVFDARLPHGGENYRAFRLHWRGRPADAPKLVERHRRLYVSWNGATDVRAWQLLLGDRPSELEPVGAGPKEAFESVVTPPRPAAFAAVAALDGRGRRLATSNVVKL